MKHLLKLTCGLAMAAIVSVCLVPAAALAHSIGFDGPVSAILHFDPDDIPVAGQATIIEMIGIKNASQLAPAACDCRLIVSAVGQKTADLSLSSTGNGFKTTYIFPAKGTYSLHFIGNPRVAGSFAPFDISYSQRIERAAVGASAGKNAMIWLALAALAVAALTAIGLRAGLKAKS